MYASALTRHWPVSAVVLMMHDPRARAARVLFYDMALLAPADAVWALWAGPGGLGWAGAAAIDPRPGGIVRLGEAAGEVLALAPGRLLTLGWPTPPDLGAVSAHRTCVSVTMEQAGAGTRLTLTHAGFGEGPDWDEVIAIHARLWPAALARMRAAAEAEDARPVG